MTAESVNATLSPGILGRGQAAATPSDSAVLEACVLMFTETGTVAATGWNGVDFTITVTDPVMPYIHPVIVKKVKSTGTTAPNLQLIFL